MHLAGAAYAAPTSAGDGREAVNIAEAVADSDTCGKSVDSGSSAGDEKVC